LVQPEGIAARVLYLTAEIRFRVWRRLILDGGMARPRATFELTGRLKVQMNRNTGK